MKTLGAIGFALLLALLPIRACEFVASANTRIEVAQLVTGSGKEKLAKLLRPHAFFGERITDDVRAATGDPDITVIDRRVQWGEIYSCNYIFLSGGQRNRALVCD